ncbi:uncharacterized protein F4812DRAFT_105310 [Daldinia caldariorum]|uniref:uncharacterized protein n=1 Tax=Daldinia caldariorum TaxID=326644 RepID=UPI002007D62A|nr:uncharacterized protein F4812DRAFT_105310 [Daldinia caldariorum]KAI1465651.1 hypothetical protein F4812DRAFT_105310 [Daldinia caldariorum]
MEASETTSQPSFVTSTLLAVAIVFPPLGTFAVGLQFYTKSLKKQKLSSDDWVCALAQLAAWGISVDIFVAAGLAGVDHTYQTLDPISSAIIFLRLLWIEGFPLVISLTLVKISILLFYTRIFATRKFRLAVHIFVGILIAWCIAVCICQLLAANPIQDAWNPLAINPLRFNYNDFSLAFAGMSVVFDVLVLCFPIPLIRKLQMTTARKAQVLAIFWLGIFCCVASAIRFYYLEEEISATVVSTGQDRYLRSVTAFIWGTVEPNTSVIAACLPCYAPLFAKHRGLPTLFASFGSLFSSFRSRDSRARAKKGSALLETDDSYQLQKPTASASRQWDDYDGAQPSYNIDTERGYRFQSGQKPHGYIHPSQIEVTREFIRTD